ncbi:MAG: hypothetical protein IJ240_01685 [Clostridia bacterium]|nr:hypothetical protein [Clostridia bacterium]
MLGILFFLLYAAGGYWTVRFLLPDKSPIIRGWLGVSLGTLMMMWFPALAAFFFDFTLTAHIVSLLPLCLAVLLSWWLRDRRAVRKWSQEDALSIRLLLAVALPLTVLGMYLVWTHDLRPASDGTLHTGQATYGDLNLHLSIITSLRNASFPPDYSILPGAKLSYPFLTDSFTTSFMLGGLSLRGALLVSSFIMLALVFVGYTLLCVKLCEKRGAVWLAILLFFINGGLGFIYLLDMQGVSKAYYLTGDVWAAFDGGSVYGLEAQNGLQSMEGLWGRLRNVLEGWYQTPTNHAEFDTYNLRWSNVIADMLIPQRTTMGGWSMLIPCLWLAVDLGWEQLGMEKSKMSLNATRGSVVRTAVLLGVMGGALPMIHTHSFAALGFASLGFLLYTAYRCIRAKQYRPILAWGLYGALALMLALPQLMTWTFAQAFSETESTQSFITLQFNWVNNMADGTFLASDGEGVALKDSYLWFYIKNVGLPFILLLLALLEKKPKRRFLASGAFLIFLLAENIRFQPNIYDNNKLFYVWYMLMAPLAADYAAELFERLHGLRSRYVIAALCCFVFFCSGGLSIARECVSDYQLFGEEDIEAAAFIETETPEHAVFMSYTQHINPVFALAGRDVVCGPDLWLYWHGFDTGTRQADIRRFYTDPAGNVDILQKYGVQYIMIGPYERSNLSVDEAAIQKLYELAFESEYAEIRIYRVTDAA